jgi:hypothetical protein
MMKELMRNEENLNPRIHIPQLSGEDIYEEITTGMSGVPADDRDVADGLE